jgi:hypothetical protein
VTWPGIILSRSSSMIWTACSIGILFIFFHELCLLTKSVATNWWWCYTVRCQHITTACSTDSSCDMATVCDGSSVGMVCVVEILQQSPLNGCSYKLGKFLVCFLNSKNYCSNYRQMLGFKNWQFPTWFYKLDILTIITWPWWHCSVPTSQNIATVCNSCSVGTNCVTKVIQ